MLVKIEYPEQHSTLILYTIVCSPNNYINGKSDFRLDLSFQNS